MNGQLLSIRNRNATGTHAATRSEAQMKFAPSQKRQEVTKADAKERDKSTEIRLCPLSGEKRLMYPLTRVVTLIVAFMLVNAPLLAPSNDEVKPRKRSVPLCFFNPGKAGRFAYLLIR
jgi:hypothetical protein